MSRKINFTVVRDIEGGRKSVFYRSIIRIPGGIIGQLDKEDEINDNLIKVEDRLNNELYNSVGNTIDDTANINDEVNDEIVDLLNLDGKRIKICHPLNRRI